MSQQANAVIKDKVRKILATGNQLIRAGRREEAVHLYKSAIAQLPRIAILHEGAGAAYMSLDDFEKASEYLKNAHRLGSRSTQLINKLAVALSRIEAPEDFAKVMETYADLSGTNSQFDILAALHFFMKGDVERASIAISRSQQKDPENNYARSICDSIHALINVGFKEAEKSRPRIAFHMNEGFHYNIMKPIFDAFKDDTPVLMCDAINCLKWFNPDVIFVANSQARKLRTLFPNAIFIYTRHGLISKNFAYEAARTCDYICLPSEDVFDQYVSEGGFDPDQLWVTGYSQMDPLFQGIQLPIKPTLSAAKECVLYAPTFTEGISSVAMITPLIESGALDVGRELIIKPHPLSFRTQKPFMKRLKEYASARANVHFIDQAGEDIIPYLQVADILISDASSTMFLYLALDKPIIAINNPDRFKSPRFDENGIEWRWREIAQQVEDIQLLPNLLNECLKHPAQNSSVRAQYAQKLFGSKTQGRTGYHVRTKVDALLAENTEVPND